MKRFLIGCAIVVMLALAGVAIWQATPTRDRFYTDAESIRTPVPEARIREILWQPPRPLPEVINLPDTDVYEPRLSGDGLTMYFVKGKAGEGADIYVAHRTNDGWSEVEPLAAMNSEYEDLGPEPTPDGRALYFYSDRPGGSGGYDLWVAYRSGDGRSDAAWLEPVNLGPNVNSTFNDYGPAVTPDGTMLYFASNRPQPRDERQPNPDAWPATLREDLFHRTYDLYVSTITAGGPAVSEPLASVNTKYNEGAPAISVFGDFIYFSSDRPGGEGGFDLFRARRLRGALEPPENLGSTVNTQANELDPGLSLGGYRLFFSSDRDGVLGSAEGPPEPRRYALYHTTSREVFRDVETRQRAAINWGAFWDAVGPGLAWLLLALLALLALLWFMRGLQDREVGLLTKCLLTSLLLHLLLLLLLSLWHVTASIAGEFRRGGRIQVALAPRSSGIDLAGQVLGAMTDVAKPVSIEIEPTRHESSLRLRTEAQLASVTVERAALERSEDSILEASVSEARPTQSTEITRRPTQQPTPQTVDVRVPELSSPHESRQVHAEEATLETPRARETSSNRAGVTALRAERFDQSTQSVVVAPDAGAFERSDASTGSSLVAASPARDATPEARAPSFDGMELPQPVADSISTPDVRLARDDGARMAMNDEAHSVLEPIAVDSGRANFRQETIRPPDAVSRPHIEPVSGGIAPIEMQTLVAVPSIRDANDIEPTMPTARMEHSQEWTPPEATAPSLTLPVEPSTTALRGNEPDEAQLDPTALLAARDVHSRRADAHAPSQTKFNSTVQAVAPDSSEPVETEKLISPSLEQFVDTTPVRVDRFNSDRTLTTTNIALEVATELELPDESIQIADADQPEFDAATALAAIEPPGTRREPNQVAPQRAMLHHAEAPQRFALLDRVDTSDIELPRLHDADVTSTIVASNIVAFSDIPAMPEPTLDLGLPREEAPPDNPYAQRESPNRLELVERKGGSRETEAAVERALAWLARHQSADGRWDADGFDDSCGQCSGETDIAADVALTGLSTLCFLGAGHTHVKDGPYRDNVSRALRWLREQQKSDGDLRRDETMYTHGIATIALSEARSMTGDAALSDAVDRAIRFIYRSRNRGEGGWRYDPGQPGDTSVLGWQIMALKSAAMSGLPVPGEAFDVARRWLERVDGGAALGLYAYMPGRPFTPSMTAEGMFVRQLIGHGPDEPLMKSSAAFVIEHLPDWESDPNTYFWYYASLALFQHGGKAWDTWNDALTRELLEHQRRDEGASGSWDPLGEWAELGGRVYQTALCTLMLEVYYRYLPLYSAEASKPVALPVDAIGAIRGSITDRASGVPLEDAIVRLVVADRDPIVARSDRNGDYTMFVPEMPDFFALSASMEGYLPDSRNVDTREVERGRLRVNFEMERVNDDVLVLEAVPEVHHLGDDRFDGRINSQFQKNSEGAAFETEFSLSAASLSRGSTGAEVRMLVKGVQRSHKIVINGETLEDRLDDAPSDGSFGEFRIGFDPSLLRPGTNTFAVIAKPSTSDIDDFEFVNIQIHLNRK